MLTMILKTCQFYAQSMIQLLIEPEFFFKNLRQHAGMKKNIGFLVLCLVFFTTASLMTGNYSPPVGKAAAVIFAGTAGTIFLSAFLGYITMVMVIGKAACFSVILNIYLFSCSITLFLSWLPFMLWFTEIWKYYLVYTGFKITCQIKPGRVFLIIIISVVIQFFLIFSANIACTK